MGKLNSMLVAAGLVLTAHQNAPAQGVNERVLKTKEALAELATKLATLPGDYKAAQAVVAKDADLLLDDDISLTDNKTIAEHATLLEQRGIAADEARKVNDALSGNNTNNGEQGVAQAEVGAAPVPVVKKIPPLNESREQKEIRLADERAFKMSVSSAKTLSVNMLDSKNWKPEPGNKLKFTVKPGRGIKFDGDNKDLELSHEAKISLTTPMAPGIYDITMSSDPDASPVSLYLSAGPGQGAIAMTGDVIPDGKTKCVANFASGQKVRIQIPKNCKSTIFQITLTGSNKNFHMDDVEIESINAENLLVNK